MIRYTLFVLTLITLAATEFDEDLNFKYKTLPRDEFIEYFNSKKFSFKITGYNHLEGKKSQNKASSGPNNQYKETIKFDLPVKTYEDESLKDYPKNFDARQHWPQCETIGEIFDENNGTQKCASSLAVSIAMAASDRICTYFNRTVRLSVQDFECTGVAVCQAYSPVQSYLNMYYRYWISYGLVTQECRAYNISRLLRQRCIQHCDHWKGDFKKDKHSGLAVYRFKREESMILDLIRSGPLLTTFFMYDDFIHYESGIYEHIYGELAGVHSVRVIGYGEENGVKYWLAANSWSSNWGENGFIKIKRLENSSDESMCFELFMSSCVPSN